MPRKPRRSKDKTERMSDRLTDAGLDELLHGPGCVLDHEEPVFPWDRWTKSVFPSRLVSRGIWLAHKDTIMAEARPLERPWGWWAYEQQDPAAAHLPNEAERLDALGVLSDLERGMLEGQRRDAAEAAAKHQRWADEYDAKRTRGVHVVPSQAAH